MHPLQYHCRCFMLGGGVHRRGNYCVRFLLGLCSINVLLYTIFFGFSLAVMWEKGLSSLF